MIYSSPYADIPLRDVTITERVFEGLALTPDRVVLIDGPSGDSLTAGQFRDSVERLAGGLVARGIGPGSVVALMAPNSPGFAVVFHAVAYAGATITTINPSYTAPEVAHQLADAGAMMLITVPALLPVAQPVSNGLSLAVIGQAEGVTSTEDLMGAPLAKQVAVDLDTSILVLPYSSGTTGLPKGVMLSHRNLVVNVDQSIVAFNIRADDTAISFLPFFHIYGLNVLMNPYLAIGATVVTMPRFDLEALLGHIQTHKARSLFVAPPVAIALAKHPLIDKFELSSLDVVVSAAAPLSAEVAEAVGKRLGCKCIQGYGMTELSPVSHVVPFDRPRAGSVGVSLPRTQTRIVDPETGNNLGPDQEGEVWVKGPQVMLGYLNNPTAIAATMSDDWLHTGDLGVMDSDGYLTIRDRLKELIKVKGFQVAPAEVEGEFLALPQVADAAVIGVPDDEAGELPKAFVVLAAGAVAEPEAIRAALRLRLASYKVPEQIVFVDAIPKSASGKILRRLLRDQTV